MNPTFDPVEHEIIRFVDEGQVTPIALAKTISKKFQLSIEEVKSAVNRLINAGCLAYSFRHGRTTIDRSFEKPVRISPHVILSPPGRDFIAHNGDIVVEVAQGAAFGDGRHPSTRIAVQAIEHVLRDTLFLQHHKDAVVLDIGTGSGILAITALRFGVEKAAGVDTDANARYEAAQNAKSNDLETRLEILHTPLEHIRDSFDMVVANLRYPTLIRIGSKLATLVKHPGAVVLSGIQLEESEKVMNAYGAYGFAVEWEATEKNWCSLVLTI